MNNAPRSPLCSLSPPRGKKWFAQGAHDVPLIVESGQVVETHHIALLIAVGASAVYPVSCDEAL